MSLVLVHRDDKGRVDSVSVWRFEGVPKCGVCDGRGWRQLPRNLRNVGTGEAVLDLELRECATCAGTGDAPSGSEGG